LESSPRCTTKEERNIAQEGAEDDEKNEGKEMIFILGFLFGIGCCVGIFTLIFLMIDHKENVNLSRDLTILALNGAIMREIDNARSYGGMSSATKRIVAEWEYAKHTLQRGRDLTIGWEE
jgi:hypothetical protein